jgi:isohexenylglutaconyl-CoA hydratase
MSREIMSEFSKTQLPETHSLILDRQGSVLKIWFNRPEAKNALNAAMAL